MNTFVSLLKDRQVGMWCKLAAWVVAAISLINIVIEVYTTVQQYSADTPPGLPTLVFWQQVRLVLPSIPYAILFFFLLYAAGVVVDYVAARKENEETDELEEDEESDLTLDEQDGELTIVPGQMK
jgi:hypothetical protein